MAGWVGMRSLRFHGEHALCNCHVVAMQGMHWMQGLQLAGPAGDASGERAADAAERRPPAIADARPALVSLGVMDVQRLPQMQAGMSSPPVADDNHRPPLMPCLDQ